MSTVQVMAGSNGSFAADLLQTLGKVGVNRGTYGDFDSRSSPLMNQAEALDVVAAARKVAPPEKQAVETQSGYRQVALRLESAFEESFVDHGHLAWHEALDAHAIQHATYRRYKAAICWNMRYGMRRVLAEQDRLQRACRKFVRLRQR